MHAIKERTEEHHNINKVVGTNLRFIRNCKRITLMGLAEVMQIRFQQIQKYEKGTNGMSAYRLWQASNILGVPVRYFFDKEYISKMSGYHGMLVRKTTPMPKEHMDIDKLRKDAAEMIDAAVVQGR